MTTVITGAANGLGRALALAAAIRGDDILAVDHDEAALGELGLPSLALDLTAQDAAERLAEAAAPISLIIHSAGISGTGPFEAIPAAHHARILKLNFEAPVAITCHLLAVGAMAQRSTHAFVGSLSTFTGYPGAVSYAASKDGLASFAGSLRKALPKGQTAAIIYPGPMATDHAARYAPDNSEKTVAARQKPEEAADIILKGLAAGRHTIIPGAKAKLLATAGRAAPGTISKALKRGLYDKIPEPKL
ncbi:MAG: SDR family NAD(P)-dependent oxidoreductase [Pseudomonadota bacterium]